MTGISIMDTERTLVTYTTRAILAIKDNAREFNYNCIGCGRCERVCPMGLSPMYIRRFMESRNYSRLDLFDAHLCMGCGTCSYICPSRLDVAISVLAAKERALLVSGGADDGEADELED